jgi:hypothetical protein
VIQRYKKKPVVISAAQWTGQNVAEVRDFVGDDAIFRQGVLHVHTLEGDMYASIGDYIIRGVQGEFYPCKPEIFEASYEPVA